jgi:hypothetical protein
MSIAEAADLPIVGRRTPEIERLVQTLTSCLAETSPSPSTCVWGRDKHSSVRQGSYARSTRVSPTEDYIDLFVVVNALGEKGSMLPSAVGELVRTARGQQPEKTVFVVLEAKSPEVVRAARDAGADEFLGKEELENEEAVIWRLRNALLRAPAASTREDSASEPPVGARPLTVGEGARLPKDAVRRAEAAIEEAVPTLPTAEERRSLGADLLEIVAPTLRDPESGRLDARRISEATGMSLAALARASGVSQQALSATPDSPGAQAGLLPIAHLSELLDEMFPPDHKRIWLQTPHPRFGGRSPVQAIEAGDAELVALSVERALEGLPD